MQTSKIAVIAVGCAALSVGACTSASSAISNATASSGSLSTAVAVSDACTLLTKDQVTAATGVGVDFTRQARHGTIRVCTFGSTSGQEVALSVLRAPSTGLTGNVPGFGNFTSQFHLTQVSGIGDQAYAGPNELIASKGSTLIVIADIDVSSGTSHQQALETMAKDVFTKV